MRGEAAGGQSMTAILAAGARILRDAIFFRSGRRGRAPSGKLWGVPHGGPGSAGGLGGVENGY